MAHKEGNILWGNQKDNPEAKHLIVYLNEHSDPSFFVGLMLTRSDLEENIKMRAEHFEGGFKYDNTHVVRACLLKPLHWAPFKLIGNLTSVGLKFIYENIPMDNPKTWENYLPIQ